MSPELMPHYSFGTNLDNVNEHMATTGPLQTQVNKSQVVVSNSMNDPFSSITRPTNIGLNAGGPNLMSKLNGGHHPGITTPTGNEIGDESDSLIYEGRGPLAYSVITEPPQAPLRKTRTAQPYMADAALEVPRLKSALSKTRLKPTTSDSADSSEGVRTFHTGPLVMNHKRTISGQTFQRAAERVASVAQDLTAVPQRQSARLLNQSRSSSSRLGAAGGLSSKDGRELKRAKATGTKGRMANASTVGRMVSGNRKPLESTEKDMKEYRPSILSGERTAPVAKQPVISETVQQQEALQWLLELFAGLGNGYFLLSRYQSQAALQAFASLPQQQRESPWALSQIGKAYFERSAYAEAEEIFARIKKIAPIQMEDMEIYSTVLWHLKNEVELAYLSHELVEADRLSPQAWCAIGNSFSLQREHDQAIKCFRRATQLDTQFAYAFTLQGHEHVANEEFDKALLAYRHAIAADKRHYNGWYGLGRVYEKMGKLEIAEKHFRCAAQINPANAVLMVCIGVVCRYSSFDNVDMDTDTDQCLQVLEKMKKTSAALVQYSHACDVDPRSALSRFKKARALMSLRRPREALAELLILKDMAPDEANVHFMLGRLYKMLRDKTSAIRHFTIALNLDPKVRLADPALLKLSSLLTVLILTIRPQAAQHIKEAMEYLEDDDDEDDDYDDEEMG